MSVPIVVDIEPVTGTGTLFEKARLVYVHLVSQRRLNRHAAQGEAPMVKLLAVCFALLLFLAAMTFVATEHNRVVATNAMHEAISHRDRKRLELLLDSGMPVDQINEEKVCGIRIRSYPYAFENGVSPLYVAVCKTDLKIVELLLKRGANVNCPVHSPYSILGRAVINLGGSIDFHGTGLPPDPPDEVKLQIIKLLVEAGADVSERKYEGGETPIEMCVRIERDDAKQLLEAKAAPLSPQNRTSD